MDSNSDIRKLVGIYTDLEHQLRGPITFAVARLNDIQLGQSDERLRRNILAARGLCRKALQVVRSIRVFSDLSVGKKIHLYLVPLTCDGLLKILIEIASDTQLLLSPSSGTHIVVHRESFNATPKDLKVDKDLIEQVIRNIVDNAAKYSYARTAVHIRGGVTAAQRFFIAIVNKGLPIRDEDLPRLATRGWRSDGAKFVTGEGSGTGLWIAREIMEAHGGELIIVPTDADGLTKVNIIF